MRWVSPLGTAILSAGCSLIGTGDLRQDGNGGQGSGGSPASTGANMTSASGGDACGNGIVDPDEACDGPSSEYDCTDAGFVNPEGASCDAACVVSYADCTNVCGNGVVEPGEECDGGGACGAECSMTAVGTCAEPEAYELDFGTLTLMGSTSGPSMERTGDCGGDGPERVYAIRANSAGYLTASTVSATGFNPLLSIRDNCVVADEIDCHDNLSGKPDIVSMHVAQGDTRYVIVDSAQNQGGSFELQISLARGTCADPVPIPIASPSYQPFRLFGTTEAQPSNHQGGCGGTAGEVVYRFMPTNNQVVAQMFGSGVGNLQMGPVLYLRSQCDAQGSEIDCDAVGTPTTVSTVDMPTVFLFVDATFFETEYVVEVRLD